MAEMQKTEPQTKQDQFHHIVRIANVDVPGNQQIRWALTHIKGIGINLADCFCAVANVNRQNKAGYLDAAEVQRLNAIINTPSSLPHWLYNRRNDYETGEDKHVVLGTLSFMQDNDLKRQKKIKSYVGVRHIHGQPVRGQRTRSHFRKNKGKVVGVVKKKVQPGTEKKEEKGKK